MQITKNNIYELWSILMQARAAAYKVRKKELLEHGLTPEQAGVLIALHFQKDEIITPARLAKLYVREPQSISIILKRMEQKGLIELKKDLERKNMIRITMTKAGEKVMRIAYKAEEIGRVTSGLSEDELNQLAHLLLKVRDTSLRELAELKFEPIFKYTKPL